MNARMTFLFLAAALPVVLLGNAPGLPADERFGTWTTNRDVPFQKIAWDARGYRQYLHVSDRRPFAEGSSTVVARWKDRDGSTWFKLLNTAASGPYQGMKFKALVKVGKAGRGLEVVYHLVEGGLDSAGEFPVMDPSDVNYTSYLRSGAGP